MPSELPDQSRDLLMLQRGVISRRQAVSLGLKSSDITARLRSARWQQLYRGVYAVFTGEPSREALLWAAVLRAGPGAVLSHQTAAELDGLAKNPSTLIHVTVSGPEHVRRIPGIVIHRSARIQLARHPCLAPPRTRIEETVLDLTQAAGTFDDAFSWLTRACGGRLTTPDRLRATIASRKKMRWRGELLVAVGDVADGVHSTLERDYVYNVERPHGLPHAKRQVRTIRGTRSEYKDSLYEEFGVCVETDGRLAHPPTEQWRDRRRDNACAADGILTLRYNQADVTELRCQTAVQVAVVLRQRGWRGALRRCGPACAVPSRDRGAL